MRTINENFSGIGQQITKPHLKVLTYFVDNLSNPYVRIRTEQQLETT